MTSAKMNRAIIKSVMNALIKVDYDPFLASPIPPKPSFFASDSDKYDAENAPEHIISLLKIYAKKGELVPKEQLERLVENEVWSRATHQILGDIETDLSIGRSSVTKFQEVREGIDVLKRLGENEDADYLEFMLEEKIRKLKK